MLLGAPQRPRTEVVVCEVKPIPEPLHTYYLLLVFPFLQLLVFIELYAEVFL